MEIAYNEGRLDLHARIKVRVLVEAEEGDGLVTRLIQTTTGRVLFNEHRPEGIAFINEILTKKNLRRIIGGILNKTSFAETAIFLDLIKEMGFYWAFKGGLSFNLGDLITPTVKERKCISSCTSRS